MSDYSADVTQLDEGRVLRFRLLRGSEPLTWSDVMDRWQNDPSFRRFYVAALADAPFAAYFWETPPVTRTTVSREFEFVLVDSQSLASVQSDRQAFVNHFSSAESGTSVIEFDNLGGDAKLVVPCPLEPLSAYSQISTFARQAPDEQQHELWSMVGAALERRLGAEPVWLNTSGLGIYWLHIRLKPQVLHPRTVPECPTLRVLRRNPIAHSG
jgi:hypothetical protein